jgi:hypothetical protein
MARYDHLKNFIDLLKWRRRKDYDNMIVITGYKGAGKSTLAYHITDRYLQAIGKKMNLSDHVVYSDSIQEIQDKINKAEDGDAIWFDEGARLILGEDWNNRNSRFLKKLFAEIRTKHLCIIFCVPYSFTRIDSKYRESLITTWIWIPLRAYGVMFQPIVSPTYEGFAETYLKKHDKSHKFFELATSDPQDARNQVFNSVRSCPSFFDSLTWPDFPADQKEKYLERRDEAVYKTVDEKERGNKTKSELMYKLHKKGLKYTEIAEIFDVKPKTVSGQISYYKKKVESSA